MINGAPKYGNDDDSVDESLARGLPDLYRRAEAVSQPALWPRPDWRQLLRWHLLYFPANVPFGAQTMATPDGRKAHTPLAEGPARPPVPIIWADGGYQFGASCRPGRSSAALPTAAESVNAGERVR
ncbi:hypothetical protein MJ579_09730 [Klebsiella pneumoniae]|nr:hypothetical protein MJ579_09730 [Klebsiella pneumoniae]